ncbi:MAG: DUF4129 domain-containing protein [Candidatus Hodarchaeota archaeon]
MNLKDINFLRRKEVLVLCCFLLTLTLVLIGIEQQSRPSSISPFLILNISLLDILGLFLPIITLILLYFRIPSLRGVSLDFLNTPRTRNLSLLTLVVILLIIIVIWPFKEFSPSVPPPEIPNTTTTGDVSTQITFTQTTSLTSSYFDFLSVLGTFRLLFIITVLFLMLLPLLVILRKSRTTSSASDASDPTSVDDQESRKTQTVLNVLDSYYQASEALEKKGADANPSLTPTEFTIDVSTKNISPPALIGNLSDLFEEAKFSIHDISAQQVELAKSLATKIILHCKSLNAVEAENIPKNKRKSNMEEKK